MAIIYHVYAGDGAGGPVDYSTPVASTSALTYDAGSLAPGSVATYAVRAFDDATGLEESNTDARVTIVLDADGDDVSGRPNPPQALGLTSVAAGACVVRWAYTPASGSGVPTGFNVYMTAGSTPDEATPAATVAYVAGQAAYTCALAGPYSLGPYTATVRAFNGSGPDGGSGAVSGVVGLPTEPLSMDAVAVSFI